MKPSDNNSGSETPGNFQGYPIYPSSEDIYNQYTEEKDVNPEEISENKSKNEASVSKNETDFADNTSGRDLDIPGSELDDNQEDIGNEDEENNYYSLGSDKNSKLDENSGE